MSQLLQQFQSVFGTEAVRVEFSEFAKDGAFSSKHTKALKDAGFSCIYLKPLSSEARDGFEASIVGNDGKSRNMANLRARLVSVCWVDEDGKPVGTAKEIGGLRADLIGALFLKVQELNGMNQEAVEDAKNA
jgi:hypothetical protein